VSRKWRNWYQNEVDEEIKGVDSRDKMKHNGRRLVAVISCRCMHAGLTYAKNQIIGCVVPPEQLKTRPIIMLDSFTSHVDVASIECSFTCRINSFLMELC